MKNKYIKKTVFCSALLICMLARPCWAVFEGEGDTSTATQADLAPAPQEEGTLSPPSESSQESVFGSTAAGDDGQMDEKLQQILAELPLPSDNGSWSVYICDLEKKSEGSICEGSMQAASLIKLYIMGAVYEDYEALTATYGQETIYNNLYSMITVSDNDAANALVNYLGSGDSTAGMNAVNLYCVAHSYENTHMGRLLLHSNEYDDNYTSVSDCGHFLKNIYEGAAEGDEACEAQFALLAAQTRRNKIPAQMPEDVSIANKTGELADVENDAGIIYDSLNDLILVFMSEDLMQPGSAQETIASLSRQIYDSYS